MTEMYSSFLILGVCSLQSGGISGFCSTVAVLVDFLHLNGESRSIY